MTTQYDIKHCPHCGEKQSITIHVNHVTTSYIECFCGARVQINNYDATPGQMLYDLISLWNKRVEE